MKEINGDLFVMKSLIANSKNPKQKGAPPLVIKIIGFPLR